MIQDENDKNIGKPPPPQVSAGNRSNSPTKETASQSYTTPLPAISLPKGGGAIKGIGEKFDVNPVTGTASFSVPIFTTPSRSDFFPKLSLSYDSGAGNGLFGLGWRLSVPSIFRKTEKGLPRYQDDEESDIFLLSGAEDLVPALAQDGEGWIRDSREEHVGHDIFNVQRYRPRIEGLFARIEQWKHQETGAIHWISLSKDNITSVYGRSSSAKVADPDDTTHVFQWLLEESYDDKGNVINYEYKPENAEHIDQQVPQEYNRLARGAGFAQTYLKRINYGNTDPQVRGNWCFQVVFDYGEHDPASPTLEEVQSWPCRLDPFSTFRPGFDLRTYRLCQRVLMFHQFAELGDTPCLVRSTDFEYVPNPVATQLISITQTGYVRHGAGYDSQSLPPLALTYTKPQVDEAVHTIDADSLQNLPIGLDGLRYQWIDLESEGLSGILTEQADAWWYKRNLGNGQFAPAELVATKPSLANLTGGQQQLLDLAGDGHKYLVQFSGPMQGYYERTSDEQWDSFTPFLSVPNVDWNDPNLRFIDLNGDGYADLLLTEDEVFTWYPSLAKEGFGPAEIVRKPFDEEQGPALVFADATQSIYLADMTGDGLTDIVRIRNGEVCYWPHCGYGHFGAKIVIDGAPVFDTPDLFDHRFLRLTDIDGSGTTDMVYLGGESVRYWINQAGNSWGEMRELVQFPPVDNLSSIAAIDFLGKGTSCLVWSSALPGDAQQPLYYIDLMRGEKPYLLKSINNNLGSQTTLSYLPSTDYYLNDLKSGTPWVTKLPFPVQVLSQVEYRDLVTDTSLVTSYQYHHGYYDGVEREFRGFGCIEQKDTEHFASFAGAGLLPAGTTTAEELHVPPVITRTWFHTGAYFESETLALHYQREYYTGDPRSIPLADPLIPANLTVEEEREAYRALKGQPLRQEIYASDGSPQSRHPYSITEHTYLVRLEQHQQDNRYAVFFTHPLETVAAHYERNPDDPRMNHQVVLEVDEYGNVTKSMAIGYPRRSLAYDEQTRLLTTYSEHSFVNLTDSTAWYRIGVPVESRAYEITGLPPAGHERYTLTELQQLAETFPTIAEIPYEDSSPRDVLQKRLIEHARTFYYSNDLARRLDLGQVESLALAYESHKQAFTSGLLRQVYETHIAYADLADKLTNEGKYVQERDGTWWIPSGRAVLDPARDPARFYLPSSFLDPFRALSTIQYDRYTLLVEQTRDPLGNTVEARNNYRVMQPVFVTDPNGNRSAVLLDTLGMVVATAVMGKEGLGEGDTLDDPTTRLEYDLFNWTHNQRPNFVHTFAREQHGPANPRWQESYAYSDGFGREIMKKVQAEPGLAPTRDASGSLLAAGGGQLVLVDTAPAVRWVGSGRTIYNNKGKPVKQYEPFFSDRPDYESEAELVMQGVTPILHYDPLQRIIRTDHPNGTFARVEFDPWQQSTWDENDTVLESRWYADRSALDDRTPEHRAAQLAARHANTPTIAPLDTLGRTFLTIADNVTASYETRVELDIEGNQLAVIDARHNRVLEQQFDMLGHVLYRHSADAGDRWMLDDAAGKPMRTWNSRSFTNRMTYDLLHRPTELYVRQGTGGEMLVERSVYGETLPEIDAVRLNLRGKVYQQYDGAGVVTNEQYDFKGNLLSSNRQLASRYSSQPDWSSHVDLDGEHFTSSTTYDALNRPMSVITPDTSETRHIYNEANLLERVDVRLRGADNWTAFVTNIDYDAKGQREQIEYGNGVRTAYTYDPLTYRLTNLTTIRTGNTGVEYLQVLHYTYDPVGNITAIQDDAQQTIFCNNWMVSPSAQYEYDAIYHLMKAESREHIGQNSQPTSSDFPFMNLPHPTDPEAMRRYTEEYRYDEVGNIMSMAHRVGDVPAWVPGSSLIWTRQYQYATPNNHLLGTSLPGDAPGTYSSVQYHYDEHGNMLNMQIPYLTYMQWTFKDELQQVNLGGGGTAYYVYDASGQRVRKVWEKSNSLVEERIYFGGYEIFRQHNGTGATLQVRPVTLERETLHIMDDRRRIAMVETKTRDEGNAITSPTSLTRYQLNNHLGSACLELDEAGHIISYEEYYPYGATSYLATRSGVEVSPKRYRYTGKEQDEESGLYYHGARYYAAWLGRWTSADPAGIADGTNLYQYGQNSPIVLYDPSGMQGIPFRTWRSAEGQIIRIYGEPENIRQGVAAPDSRHYRQVGNDFYYIDRPRSAASTASEPTHRGARPSRHAPIAQTRAASHSGSSTPGSIAEEGLGVGIGTAQSLTPGGFIINPLIEHLPTTRRFESTRAAGQIITGIVQIIAGLSIAAGGGVLAGESAVAAPLTWGGSLVGSVWGGTAVSVGLATAAHGALNVAVGISTATHAMHMSGGGEGGTGGGGSREDDGHDEYEEYYEDEERRGRGQAGRRSGGRKTDIGQIEDVADDAGISEEGRRAWGDFVEQNKQQGNRGSANQRGDFTYSELGRLARDFLRENPQYRSR